MHPGAERSGPGVRRTRYSGPPNGTPTDYRFAGQRDALTEMSPLAACDPQWSHRLHALSDSMRRRGVLYYLLTDDPTLPSGQVWAALAQENHG
jgi:hypothetical protein